MYVGTELGKISKIDKKISKKSPLSSFVTRF